jgi:hypothetical protein
MHKWYSSFISFILIGWVQASSKGRKQARRTQLTTNVIFVCTIVFYVCYVTYVYKMNAEWGSNIMYRHTHGLLLSDYIEKIYFLSLISCNLQKLAIYCKYFKLYDKHRCMFTKLYALLGNCLHWDIPKILHFPQKSTYLNAFRQCIKERSPLLPVRCKQSSYIMQLKWTCEIN